MSRNLRRRASMALAGAILVSLLRVASASAAVVVTPASASAGTAVDLAFHVTNQQVALATDQIVITFPVAPLVDTVSANSPAGWSSSVDASTGNVATVTFSEGTLPAGGSADFVLTTPIPKLATSMNFKVQQTYTDGSTTVPDTASVTIVDNAPPPTAPPPTVASVATTTTAVQITTTPGAAVVPSTGKGSGTWSTGRILIAVGVGIALAMYLRVRRVRR